MLLKHLLSELLEEPVTDVHVSATGESVSFMYAGDTIPAFIKKERLAMMIKEYLAKESGETVVISLAFTNGKKVWSSSLMSHKGPLFVHAGSDTELDAIIKITIEYMDSKGKI